MNLTSWTYRLVAVFLAIALCGAPEFAQAMGQSQSPQPQQQAPQQPTPGNPDTAMPNPARPPLQPAETLPQAPSATRQQQSAPAQTQQEPAGAGAAPAGATAGGAASRPAGTAIAPAKQRQTRSLLIKLGAIGGAAIAIGTVVALTRATGSKPPGAR